MSDAFEAVVDRFVVASSHFARILSNVRPEQWEWVTPCTEWNVRQLVNHQTRANLNFTVLVEGGTKEEFARLRDIDALGDDPVSSYGRSVEECARAFARPGALGRTLDYPLGPVSGSQALAVRTTDSTIHTWDLARAIGDDETLNAGLIAWIEEYIDDIYAGLPEMPTSVATTHRFFAAPDLTSVADASPQDRLLRLTGRRA